MFFKLQAVLVASSLVIIFGVIFALAPTARAATGSCACTLEGTPAGADDAAREASCRTLCEGVGMTTNYAGGACRCSAENFDVAECERMNRPQFQCVGAAAESPAAGGAESSVDLGSLNPLGETDIRIIIGRIIKYALGIVGSLALLMFIYGGGLWLLSGGQSERIQKGKDTILWATIGLAVIFASYALVNFVIKALTS